MRDVSRPSSLRPNSESGGSPTTTDGPLPARGALLSQQKHGQSSRPRYSSRVNATPDALPSLVELTPGEEKVLLQTLQFEAALPELLSAHAGRWIVWLDGVRSLHDSEAEAHAWAADNLPPDSGRLVVRVAARRPVVLSGIAVFGL